MWCVCTTESTASTLLQHDNFQHFLFPTKLQWGIHQHCISILFLVQSRSSGQAQPILKQTQHQKHSLPNSIMSWSCVASEQDFKPYAEDYLSCHRHSKAFLGFEFPSTCHRHSKALLGFKFPLNSESKVKWKTCHAYSHLSLVSLFRAAIPPCSSFASEYPTLLNCTVGFLLCKVLLRIAAKTAAVPSLCQHQSSFREKICKICKLSQTHFPLYKFEVCRMPSQIEPPSFIEHRPISDRWCSCMMMLTCRQNALHFFMSECQGVWYKIV